MPSASSSPSRAAAARRAPTTKLSEDARAIRQHIWRLERLCRDILDRAEPGRPRALSEDQLIKRWALKDRAELRRKLKEFGCWGRRLAGPKNGPIRLSVADPSELVALAEQGE